MPYFELTSTGIVALRDTPSRSSHFTRLEGHVAKPNRPKLEQDVAWVFPELAPIEITIQTVQSRVRWQWHLLVGTLAWRHFGPSLQFENDWSQQANEIFENKMLPVIHSVFDFLDNEELDAMRAVALLDKWLDHFGPSDKALAYSVAWGLQQEFKFSTMYSDKSLFPVAMQIRYQSFENFFEDEYDFLEHNSFLYELSNYYINNAWDLAAALKNAPTLEATIADLESQQSAERLANMAMGAFSAYRAIEDVRSQSANRRFRNQRAKQLRNENGWFF